MRRKSVQLILTPCSLWKNAVRAEGANALADALTHNATLVTLVYAAGRGGGVKASVWRDCSCAVSGTTPSEMPVPGHWVER